jgi:hypothetical protein
MNGYKLTREWFEFSCQNIDKVNSNHTAMYLYLVDSFNFNKWPDMLGVPTEWTMQKLGIKNYKTYKKTFDDLILFKKIELVQKSTNNHTSNIIRLIEVVKNTKATTKAHTNSGTKATTKESTNPLLTYINIETINNKTLKLINENATLLEECLEDWIKEYNKQNKVDVDFDKLKTLWNTSFYKTKVPKVDTITERRKKAVNAVLRIYGKEKIRDAILKIKDSKFLLGEQGNDWKINFDWLFIVGNFTKVIEGNYDKTTPDTSKSIFG